MQDQSTGEGENTDTVGLNVNWTGAEWLGSRYVSGARCSGCVMFHVMLMVMSVQCRVFL